MKKDVLAIVGLFFTSVVYFYPLIKSPTNQIVNDYDGVFTAWVMKTIGDKLISGEPPFWDGKIFFPHQNTLAFSDPYLTNTLLTLPLRLVTQEPIVLFNTALVLSHILTITMLFFLLHELTNDRKVSVVGSLVFGYSLLWLQYAGHLHTLSIEWVILGLLALTKLALSPTKRWLYVYFGAFLLQTANAFLPGYWLIFSFLIYLLAKPFRTHVFGLYKHLMVGTIFSLGVLLPLIKPYLEVQHTYNYERPLTEVIHFSLSPDEVMTKYFSPGLYVFIAIGLVLSKRTAFKKVFGGLSVTTLVLALGPALHWLGKTVKIFSLHIPLPYLILYYTLPGFGGFRTPSRWIVLSAIALTALSAIAIGQLKQKFRNPLLAIILVVGVVTVPLMPYVPIPSLDDYPQEYYILHDLPPGAVLELPIFRWGSDSFSKNESWRMLYQTYHQHPLVNGYSGFSPPEWEQMVAKLQRSGQIAPDENIRYVIIHENEYEQLNLGLPQLNGYSEINRLDRAVIYEKD